MRRIITGTKVTTSNLNSLVRQATHFHTVQLLVILIRSRVIDFTNTAFHVVLKPHTRKRWVLGFAKNRFASCRQNAVFLIEQNRVGIQSRGTVLELGTIVQVESRFIDIVNQVYSVVFNRIDTSRVVHPVHFGRIFFDLLAFFKFKASHLLTEGGRSGDGKNP